MTTSFSVVGSPISHSLSPALHLAAYRFLGLDFLYEMNEVEAGALANFVKDSEFAGVSVTMPLKQEAFELGSFHDEDSQRTRVSNTLVRAIGGWNAYNTDVFGIRQALLGLPTVTSTVVLGSGATARSGLVALSQLAPNSGVSILSRNAGAADQLVEFAKGLDLVASVQEVNALKLIEADLVLSLVPSGSFAQLWAELGRSNQTGKGVLFDVAYNPWPSTAALAWGDTQTISGIEMLIWQAIRQIELFLEASNSIVDFDRLEMYAVMKNAVSGK